jgi:hypothetical protein
LNELLDQINNLVRTCFRIWHILNITDGNWLKRETCKYFDREKSLGKLTLAVWRWGWE